MRGENVNASSAGRGVEGTTNGFGAGIHGTETSNNAAALAGLFDGNDQAIVEPELRNGRFVIRTEHGGTKVSWTVTGLRRDAHAREHPLRAVAAKAGPERGRYLHRELYGEPRSRAVIRPVKATPAARTAANRPNLVSER